MQILKNGVNVRDFRKFHRRINLAMKGLQKLQNNYLPKCHIFVDFRYSLKIVLFYLFQKKILLIDFMRSLKDFPKQYRKNKILLFITFSYYRKTVLLFGRY